MKRIVIVHEKMGIFVGGAMGLAFFSMIDTGGQSRAVLFDDESDAREFLREWEPKQDPNDYYYVEVEAREEWATVAELIASGLERFTMLLLLAVRPEGMA